MVMGRGRQWQLAGGFASVLCSLWLQPARGDTLEQSIILSYQNNPQLNAQRAATRAVDESVAIALGGYRPRIAGTFSAQEVYLDTLSRSSTAPGGNARSLFENAATSTGVTVSQTLFN